ncbi:MAG: hypothetical protein OHK0024_20230 [Thalassobaculales bacterium]
MIRLTVLVWLVLAAVTGGAVFHVKFQVAEREGELKRLNREIVQHQEAIHVLQAEWSYLNRPERLADLIRRHLEMQPAREAQMAQFRRGLPPVLPEGGEDSPLGGRSILATMEQRR